MEELATFVISIPRGRAYDASGSVLTHDDRLLVDVSRQLTLAVGLAGAHQHTVFRRMWLNHCHRIPGVVAVLATAGGENYFHWLTESLLRLEILRHCWPGGLEAIDRFIVNRGVAAVVESLAAFGIDSDRLVLAKPGSHYLADTLVVPSPSGYSGHVPKWACKFLRTSMAASASPPSSRRRVYISRTAARYRRIRNEPDVVASLRRYGFETLAFESLDFRSQVAAMADVDIVVAPHGAGLTNILWCPPGAALVEIFSPNYVVGCYWPITSHLGIDCWYLLGEGPRPAEGVDPHLVEDDITGAHRPSRAHRRSRAVNPCVTGPAKPQRPSRRHSRRETGSL
ncbi:MAG: glycosyltransferase family 61 protein [Planctomycetia bacterium]